jgi:hypothetical protein
MLKEFFNVEIIGKEKEIEGWIFKETVYKIVIKFETGKVISRNSSLEQYCTVNVGDKLRVAMYSSDKRLWYFSQEEATQSMIFTNGYGI